MSQLLSLLSLSSIMLTNGYYPPEQIHIALGRTPDSITFNWLTWDYPIRTKSQVLLGTQSLVSALTTQFNGSQFLFTDGGAGHWNRTIHMVNVTGLNASSTYFYQVGDPEYGFSSIYSFKTQPNGNTLKDHLPTKYVIYGDLGHDNAQVLSMVTELGLSDEFDVLIHVGDMAYQPQYNNGTVGDQFMNDIQALATHIPYMMCPGNAEAAYNFSHYSERFRGQPYNLNTGPVWTGSGPVPNNWYMSWNNGMVHWIMISTEIYFDFKFMIQDQYEWLINDLQDANKNRTLAPWVIVIGHRPMYCDNVSKSNKSDTADECGPAATRVRDGIDMNNTGVLYFGLEDIFYEYGVDFFICGHEHDYERMYDIYKNKTTKTTTNMPSTTYILTGSAGCNEGHDIFNPNIQQPYVAIRTMDYSFTKWNVYNNTHIHLQQIISDTTLPPDQQGKIIDDIWYIQNKHGPFKHNYPNRNTFIDNTIHPITYFNLKQ
eukprot:318052_1